MKKVKHIIYRASLLFVLFTSAKVFAAPEYISSECDVRILGLSQKQKNQLHQLRQNWKENRDQIQMTARRRNSDLSVRTLINKNGFDVQYARKIAQESYNESIQLAVAELNFHYQVFHTILTENQKKMWSDYCVVN